ncbi:MAG: hypothetical protein PHS59_00695 [Paludibacter sp.]|nr:hypothetical protein [Paludibacter sp.]
MKKLSLILGMVLAVSMVMAQTVKTTIGQYGVRNEANVTQEACLSGCPTIIMAVQTGSWNVLNTSQTGMDNYIELRQGGVQNEANMEQLTCDIAWEGSGSTGGKNTADIYQTGTYGEANLSQMEKVDVVEPPANPDLSTNVARASQSGNDNTYNLDQGRRTWKPTNFSTLAQTGNRNMADIDQFGATNYSDIKQYGMYNDAFLDQHNYNPTNGSVPWWSKSYSTQVNKGNFLDVYQHGNANLQYAESTQNGNANETDIKQVSMQTQLVAAVQYGTDIINITQIDQE